ncbi:MAG: efflux RND transporter permease subunit [Steroidobacteraceae bacterium]
MNLATWSIRDPIPSLLLFALLSLAGLWGFRALSVQDLPDLTLPAVRVSLAQPGVAPDQLETEVARRVENSLATVTGMRHIQTEISEGLVSLEVQFEIGTSITDVLLDVKDAVDRIRPDLPPDLLQPSISAERADDESVLTYAIERDAFDETELSWFVDDTVARTLLQVEGLERIERLGGVTREVQVVLDPALLASQGATVIDVSQALSTLQQQNSGGRAQLGLQEQAMRTIATVDQANELSGFPLSLPGGNLLRLDQVASVEDTIAERHQIARLDGKPVVGFRVFRAKGKDVTRLAEGVAGKLAQLEGAHPGLRTTLISGTVDYTREQFRGSMQMLYEGSALAIFVIWLFLRSWRATLVAATALPLSILPTFLAMWWFGFSLNTVTLLALCIVVGILVDDAIVEVENIERHAAGGKPIREAAIEAVTEIAPAVFATTMALVAVFLPTAMMGGVPGLFFREFGWTAVVAVLASLLVARLVTPMMAVWLLRPTNHLIQPDGAAMTSYLRAVRWCLRRRGLTLALATAFLVGSLALIPLVPAELLPGSDRGFTSVSVELPPGSSLEQTLAVAEDAREQVTRVDGVSQVLLTVGVAGEAEGDESVGEVRRGSLLITLAPRRHRGRQGSIENAMRAALRPVAGARFTVGSGDLGEKLEIILSSGDSEALISSSKALQRELASIPGLANISSTASMERPEVVVRPNLTLATQQGISTEAIGDTVRFATAGGRDTELPRLNLEQRQLYIRALLPPGARQDPSALGNLRVRGNHGLVTLDQVATMELQTGPAQIARYDRQRQVTVSAELGGTPSNVAMQQVMALPSIVHLPASVQLVDSFEAELGAEFGMAFAVALVVGVLSIYAVLVILFRDFLQPVTILSAIPLSVGGAILGLLIGGGTLSIPSMIGFVMLMGIVTKNSILLVDYATMAMRDRGLSQLEALVDACHKRVRPIVMTTAAMVAGMLPIALGLGADASFRKPMALAVIGGLITSTALSLLVVPTVFSQIHDFEKRIRDRLRGKEPLAQVCS